MVSLDDVALPLLRYDADADARIILLNCLGGPADEAVNTGKLGHPCSQNAFGQILRQPLAVLEIVSVDDFPKRRRVPVLAAQSEIGRHTTQGKASGQNAGRSYLVGDAPAVEVFHRVLRQPLAFRNPMLLRSPFHVDA